MTWFEQLVGFPEQDRESVRSQLFVDNSKLISRVNQMSWEVGTFETPSLAELRRRSSELQLPAAETHVRQMVADVRDLHKDSANQHSVFQVASQFNCLEMVSPHVTPDQGVGIYEKDLTQGPACSISAGAGTIFRNYLVPLSGKLGQTQHRQIDCLEDLGQALGNIDSNLWRMQNGYCLPTESGLNQIEQHLSALDKSEWDDLSSKLRIGVQANTQVTLCDCQHCVTQAFCSALPIAYSSLPESAWDLFPQLVLQATYEATFHVALQNLANTGNPRLYLTLVGGGVFGNRLDWILFAIDHSLRRFADSGLDVSLVSYGTPSLAIQEFLEQR